MAGGAIIVASPSSELPQTTACASTLRARATFADYWAMTKPEINFLIGIATFGGFYLGSLGGFRELPIARLIHSLSGTLLVASGAAVLNQYMERRFDARMRRTARRPVAAGRIEPVRALWFGISLSAAGVVYLVLATNALAGLLALFTLVSYLFLYTPLKRTTSISTAVGAIPGAMPPLIGCAAAAGRPTFEAWILFSILFLWQFPHFMAIAWMYREDYDRAGYVVLPGGESRLRFVSLQTTLPLLALIPPTVVLPVLRHTSLVYLVGVLLLSFGFSYYGIKFVIAKSNASARRLLLASIIYLPLLLLLMVLLKSQ
jgi:protoheme IX farnesyltransferase